MVVFKFSTHPEGVCGESRGSLLHFRDEFNLSRTNRLYWKRLVEVVV